MTKNDIVDALIEDAGSITRKHALETVELVFQTIKETLADGENVKLHGFGTFSTKAKKSRVGRNPQTGEPITISPRTVVRFTASDVLRNKLNQQDES